jgi:nitrite reductase/ring-hydroxylating ferredoxin subunit
MQQRSKILTFCLLSAVVFIFNNCGGDESDVVPNVEVKVNYISIYEPAYNSLLSISGSAIVPGVGYGGNGIIIFRVNEDEFKAYDCTCTYEIAEGNAVIKDSNNVAGAKCPYCGSKYELIFGTVSAGPAKYPLKQYHVYFSDPYLTIRN